MADMIFIALAGVVILQFVLGIFAHMDANRRKLDHPVLYFYGISIPLVGFLVLAAYLSRREELPTWNLSPPSATETADDAVWTIENRGLRRLPRRLAYTIQDGNTLWRVAVAGPPILLVLSALVDSRIAIVLFAFCGLFWLTYLSTAHAFTNTTTRLDPTNGTIQVTWRGGDHPLSSSGSEQEIDLTDVQRVELRCVGTQPMVKFQYENPFSINLGTLLVSPDQLDILRDMLTPHEILVSDRIQEGTSRNVVWRRNTEGLISLVVIPFGAGVVWPQFFFTGPVLPLVVFTILWLVVKCFASIFGRIKSLFGVFSN
jgi:hypothetical protein